MGTIASAILGGTASHLGGGKFANGAVTAAFGYVMNQLSPSGRPKPSVNLVEPSVNEVVVVINNNGLVGQHAGMFAGNGLHDPAGNYENDRARDPNWKAPTLRDYVKYHINDGEDIRIYRFKLDQPVFDAIDKRIAQSGPTPILFCAAAVQNTIAGAGPFSGIQTTTWTSPSALAKRLDVLTAGKSAPAVCLRPDGKPC
jgi:hypothetical protein